MIWTFTAPLVITYDDYGHPRYHYWSTVVELPDDQAKPLLDQGVIVAGDTLPPPKPAEPSWPNEIRNHHNRL